MEWEREKCLQLVDIYEQYPVLWNPKHGLYYNKIKKHDAWVSIGEIMQCSSEDVKKKMESILASFRREKSKGKKTVGTGKGTQEVYVSKWFAFTRMSFLLDRDKPTQTISSLEENIEMDETASQEDIESPVDDRSTTINVDPAQTSRRIPESQIVLHKGKGTCPAIIKKGTKQKVSNKIDEAFEMLKNVVEKEKPEDICDGCSDYGKHVANKLRNYSERTKAVVQYHFNNILFQADMGHFDVNGNTSTMSFNQNHQNSPFILSTGNPTTSIPTPSPQETTQSGISYTDLSSPLSEVNCQEKSVSTESAASFLSNWQIQSNM